MKIKKIQIVSGMTVRVKRVNRNFVYFLDMKYESGEKSSEKLEYHSLPESIRNKIPINCRPTSEYILSYFIRNNLQFFSSDDIAQQFNLSKSCSCSTLQKLYTQGLLDRFRIKSTGRPFLYTLKEMRKAS